MRASAVSAVLVALLASGLPVVAQAPAIRMNAPPPPAPGAPAPNPALEQAQRVFDALPEAARKAIQDDLIWGSTFTATVSGSFGPRTFDAIRKFQSDMKLKPDGILTEDSRKALREVANRARAAARYAPMTDPRTGARLGISAAVFPKMDALPGGTRWQSADGAVVLETALAQGGMSELPAAFERVLAIPGRKVTYKLLREDFFVVAGENGARSFYTRYGLGPTNLRGYTISYPTQASKALERTVISLANSFQPIPGVSSSAAAPDVKPPQQTGQPQSPQVAPPQTAGMIPAGLIATGVVLAPGKVATAGTVAACPDLRVRGQQARIARAAGGLTLIDADTGNARPFGAAAAGAEEMKDPALVIVGFVGGARAPQLTVSSGSLLAGGDAARAHRIEAPLHREAAGSLVFTRSAALVGAIASPRATPRLVAGIVPAASHALIDAKAILTEAGGKAQDRTAHTSGAIAALVAPSLVAIDCAVSFAPPKE